MNNFSIQIWVDGKFNSIYLIFSIKIILHRKEVIIMAIKDIKQLEKAIQAYVKRHGMSLKYSQRNYTDNIYNVLTSDYTQLESKIITMKNGKTRVVFKVDGKIESLYK